MSPPPPPTRDGHARPVGGRRVGWAVGALGLLLVACAGCDRTGLYDGAKLVADPEPPPPVCPPQRTPNELKVKVNEVMVENAATLEDEYGRYPPWVELYNDTDEVMDLGDVALSDSFLNFDKWRIPCVAAAKLPPRGFLVIFLDGGTPEEKDFHAGFTVTPGTSFTLIVNKGSDFFTFDGKNLATDQSAGRHPDGGSQIAALGAPTPGAPNEAPGSPGALPEGRFIRGDANADRRVDITDMSRVLDVLFRAYPAPVCEDRLDANDDGKVDVADALAIGNALFLRGPAIPEPYPEEGRDPTPDALPCPQG